MPLVDRDPVWPPGAAEAGLGAIQQAGLAALHGAAWQAEPELIDPDLGADRRRPHPRRDGCREGPAALRTGGARRRPFLRGPDRCRHRPDDALRGLAGGEARTRDHRGRAGRPARPCGLHAALQPRPPAGHLHSLRLRSGRPAARPADRHAARGGTASCSPWRRGSRHPRRTRLGDCCIRNEAIAFFWAARRRLGALWRDAAAAWVLLPVVQTKRAPAPNARTSA